MTDTELERMLASLPVRAPDAARERELLARLGTARGESSTWWTRRIPLWQAAAACIAVFAASLAWLRESPRRSPAIARPVVVRIEQPLFASAGQGSEAVDISRWQPLPPVPAE